jgi:hypothetical protein
MRYGLLIIFGFSNPPRALRDYLVKLNGVEFGSDVWFLPNGAPTSKALADILKRLESPNADVAVFRVARHESQASIQGFASLLETFQPEREPGQ